MTLERTEQNKIRIEKDFADHDTSAWLQDPPQLSKGRALVRNLAKDAHEIGAIERTVRVWKLVCIAPSRGDVIDSRFVRSPYHVIEHLLLYVKDIEHAIRRQ
jgi:hypothetical protein